MCDVEGRKRRERFEEQKPGFMDEFRTCLLLSRLAVAFCEGCCDSECDAGAYEGLA